MFLSTEQFDCSNALVINLKKSLKTLSSIVMHTFQQYMYFKDMSNDCTGDTHFLNPN